MINYLKNIFGNTAASQAENPGNTTRSENTGPKLAATRRIRNGRQTMVVETYTESGKPEDNSFQQIFLEEDRKKAEARCMQKENRLLREKLFYEKAGRPDIAAEMEFQLKCHRADSRYERITLKKAAEELGLPGLEKAVREKREKADAKGRAGAEEFMKRLYVSEAELDQWLHRSKDAWVKDPQAAIYMAEYLADRITEGRMESLVKRLQLKEEYGAEQEAYISIRRLPSMGKSYDPPLLEWKEVVKARDLGVFDELFLMAPMIGPVRAPDPLVAGVIRDPGAFLDRIEDYKGDRSESRVTVENVERINFGAMYRVAEWV